MAEDVRFEALSDVGVVDTAEVVGDLLDPLGQEDHVLVPLLVDESLETVEVAGQLVGQPLPELLPAPQVLATARTHQSSAAIPLRSHQGQQPKVDSDLNETVVRRDVQ
jgi:hypothetical protein